MTIILCFFFRCRAVKLIFAIISLRARGDFKKQKLHQTVEQSYLLRKYEQLKINKLDYDQKEQNRVQSK